MYNLQPTNRFKKGLEKIIKSGRLSRDGFKKIHSIMKIDPFDTRLKTHKVTSRNLNKRYSSYITRDLRIIWDFDANDNLILLLLDIGGHEGSRRVYK